jgi:hypothetical protein
VAAGRLVPGALLFDSVRESLVVVVAVHEFIDVAVNERRGSGRAIEVLCADRDYDSVCDTFVTCVMVVWAVSIFVGMGCLAVMI